MNTKRIYLSAIALIVALSSIQISEAKMTKEAHALYQQACNYEYRSDYLSAISTIQKALAINGDDAMLYTKIAGLYSDVGRYEDALGAYKKARFILNTNIITWTLLILSISEKIIKTQ